MMNERDYTYGVYVPSVQVESEGCLRRGFGKGNLCMTLYSSMRGVEER